MKKDKKFEMPGLFTLTKLKSLSKRRKKLRNKREKSKKG